MTKQGYVIESVIRALEVLEYLAAHGGTGRVSDVATEVGCSKNTAFRLLKSLEERDFVRQAEDSSYELTFKLMNLGESVVRSKDLHTLARPHLEKLVKEHGETASVAILDGHSIVYLDRVLGGQPYSASYPVGGRASAHSTSLGKAILAYSPDSVVENIIRGGLTAITDNTITDPGQFLAELRTTAMRGYSLDNQENVLGIRCVGAPIFDRRGDAVGAISVAAMVIRIADDQVPVLGETLVREAAAISSKLGFSKARQSARNLG